MAKGLEGVRRLVEVCTVAIETGTGMGEVYVAVEDLCVTVTVLVVVQHVGMNQVDTLVRRLLTWRTLPCRLHGKDHGQSDESDDDKQQPPHLLILNRHQPKTLNS